MQCSQIFNTFAPLDIYFHRLSMFVNSMGSIQTLARLSKTRKSNESTCILYPFVVLLLVTPFYSAQGIPNTMPHTFYGSKNKKKQKQGLSKPTTFFFLILLLFQKCD